ncbi:MAG: hypothetical protein ABIP20_06880 [Chthoniobacteraceae bacterium]
MRGIANHFWRRPDCERHVLGHAMTRRRERVSQRFFAPSRPCVTKILSGLDSEPVHFSRGKMCTLAEITHGSPCCDAAKIFAARGKTRLKN